jgi:hypothetical protein
MNRLYRVWAKFEPDFLNPLTGRRGQWRVRTCWIWNQSDYARFDTIISSKCHGMAAFPVSRFCQPGSIIRPHAELRRVLAARKAAA